MARAVSEDVEAKAEAARTAAESLQPSPAWVAEETVVEETVVVETVETVATAAVDIVEVVAVEGAVGATRACCSLAPTRRRCSS